MYLLISIISPWFFHWELPNPEPTLTWKGLAKSSGQCLGLSVDWEYLGWSKWFQGQDDHALRNQSPLKFRTCKNKLIYRNSQTFNFGFDVIHNTVQLPILDSIFNVAGMFVKWINPVCNVSYKVRSDEVHIGKVGARCTFLVPPHGNTDTM